MNPVSFSKNNATYRKGDQKPRFIKERFNDPKEYGFICPGCEMRYGDPQMNGYVDVRRCVDCHHLFSLYEEEKREKQSARSLKAYRKKKMSLKEQRANPVL